MSPGRAFKLIDCMGTGKSYDSFEKLSEHLPDSSYEWFSR